MFENDYAKRYCANTTTVKVITEGVSIWPKMYYVNDPLQQLHKMKFNFKYLDSYNISLAQVNSR